LFCFHGYGRESFTFSFLERRLANSFTIIAIDIPHHGLTEWNEEAAFKPVYLTQFLSEIMKRLDKENMKFTLFGFSMGGRIALYLTQLLPEKVDRLILLAPDGLSFNFWRWVASETWLGSEILRYTITNPGWIQWLINKAERWHIIHTNLADFTRYYLQSNEQRKKLYVRWISMRMFRPSLAKLKSLIKKHKIPVRMLFGTFDRVIPYTGGEKFKEGMDELVTVEVMQWGHNLLSEAHAGKIAELIND